MSPSSSVKRAQPVERDGRRQFNKLPLNVFSMSYGNDIKYLVEAVEVGEQKWIGQAPMDLQTSGRLSRDLEMEIPEPSDSSEWEWRPAAGMRNNRQAIKVNRWSNYDWIIESFPIK